MILRRVPPRKKRKGTRRGQATPAEVTAIRTAVYARSGGLCELQLSSDCIKGVLEWEGDTPWDHGHLVHLKAKRRYGTHLELSAWGCHHCHLISLHMQGGNGKIVPAK
jgi:hypothetical protein